MNLMGQGTIRPTTLLAHLKGNFNGYYVEFRRALWDVRLAILDFGLRIVEYKVTRVTSD